MVGVDTPGIDHGFNLRFGGFAFGIADLAGKSVETSGQPAETKMAFLELDIGMGTLCVDDIIRCQTRLQRTGAEEDMQ